MKDEFRKITEMLLKAGFTYTEDNTYSNNYCSVCLDYNKEGETVITNSFGSIMERLPTNCFALIGWLVCRGMISLSFVEHIHQSR